MSSTNKTNRLNLNQWLGSDKPEREDFNRDNAYIENTVTAHLDDTVCHTSQEDRSRWDNNTYTGLYFGNGVNGRTVSADCPFEAKTVIVFALNKPLSVNNYGSGANYNYFGIGTYAGNMLGLTLNEDGKSFVVAQSTAAEIQGEYLSLNEYGEAYCYILIR